MTALFGDFVLMMSSAALPDAPRLDDVSRWPQWRGAPATVQRSDLAPGLRLWTRGDFPLRNEGGVGGLGLMIAPSTPGTTQRPEDVLAGWIGSRQTGEQALRGRYVFLLWDGPAQRAVVYTDVFRTHPVYHLRVGNTVVIASDLRLAIAAGGIQPKVNLSSVYHYLNFSYVPAPHSAIHGISKLPACSLLDTRPSGETIRRYWDATYPADNRASEEDRVNQLHDTIVQTVQRYRPQGGTGAWGTFLSGGTDSSSISGILARQVAGDKVASYSIGFAEEGYDELGYSQIASSYFGLDPHERRVGEEESVAAISELVQAYDEPFGNSSGIPTFYCADLAARDGRGILVAGDGGDEIYGGNERYRKDQIFEMFHTAPAIVRALGHGVAGLLKVSDARLANRVKNFVHRGSLPNPDRFYSDDSFASDCYEELLSPSFRQAVGINESLQVQRDIYAQAQADCTIHRLMYLDLKMTIADNDVTKVVRAAKRAGIAPVFPYLDRDLVDFTGHLPGTDKVNGTSKRYLFKKAAVRLLPEDIIKKKKQGFGLPVSVWLRRKGPMHDLVGDVLLSDRTAARGYFNRDHIQHLWRRHERGAWDHASELYMLLMLELWHRAYVD
ncbi:MAG TPA: asparagine synthase C-terminal domain-containing protein [Burkholderiaceae bacterium]|nr:asparagine synthase C-terminal domain-containing protein [Burkholderiaceae bacterium]